MQSKRMLEWANSVNGPQSLFCWPQNRKPRYCVFPDAAEASDVAALSSAYSALAWAHAYRGPSNNAALHILNSPGNRPGRRLAVRLVLTHKTNSTHYQERREEPELCESLVCSWAPP